MLRVVTICSATYSLESPRPSIGFAKVRVAFGALSKIDPPFGHASRLVLTSRDGVVRAASRHRFVGLQRVNGAASDRRTQRLRRIWAVRFTETRAMIDMENYG